MAKPIPPIMTNKPSVREMKENIMAFGNPGMIAAFGGIAGAGVLLIPAALLLFNSIFASQFDTIRNYISYIYVYFPLSILLGIAQALLRRFSLKTGRYLEFSYGDRGAAGAGGAAVAGVETYVTAPIKITLDTIVISILFPVVLFLWFIGRDIGVFAIVVIFSGLLYNVLWEYIFELFLKRVPYHSPSLMEAIIYEAIRIDPQVMRAPKDFKVRVTDDLMAHISGVVSTKHDYDAIIGVCRRVVGVKGIDTDGLVIREEEAM